MKQNDRIVKEKGAIALVITVVICALVLVVLLVVTVILASATSGILSGSAPLNAMVLLSEDESSVMSIERSVLPAFIGVGTRNIQKGISAGDNIVRELYALLTPCLVYGLNTKPVRMEASAWDAAMVTYPHVFVQYHAPMPIEFLQASGAAEGKEMPVGEKTIVTQSLFLMLSTATGGMELLVKTTDGAVLRYICNQEKQDEYPSFDTLEEWVQNFPNNFYRYTLYNQGKTTEPIFLERIRVQNVTMATGSTEILESNKQYIERFLRLLNFNPDKLSQHQESNGKKVFVESHGILQYYRNRYSYMASSEDGIDIGHIIGYKERYSVYDIIRTANTIAERFRSIKQDFLGGDAELVLTACTTTEDTITLEFSYTYDNLLISGYQPALVMTVSSDYRILSLQIVSIIVAGWGDHRTVYTEAGIHAQKVTENGSAILTYPVDFFEQSIFPIWTICTPLAET